MVGRSPGLDSQDLATILDPSGAISIDLGPDRFDIVALPQLRLLRHQHCVFKQDQRLFLQQKRCLLPRQDRCPLLRQGRYEMVGQGSALSDQ